MKRFFLLLLAVAVGLSAEAGVLGSLPTSCAPNEIIYTTQYGYPLTLPNPGVASESGANLMDNQYQDGIGRLIFDADIKRVPSYMFNGCTALVGVVLPQGVTSIGERAFEGCTHLTAISMLGSVEEIGANAFEGCNIREVNISDLNAWCRIRFDSEPWHFVQVYNNYYLVTDLTIPSYSRINNYTFCGWDSLTNVTIPDCVDYIGNGAFAFCQSLSSITIPNGVVSLGDDCFVVCTALTSVTIPDSVTSIGRKAFSNCKNLTHVTIPNGVTSISDELFFACDGLTSVSIPNSVTYIGEDAFTYCHKLTNIIIPNGVTTIAPRAFFSCRQLTSVSIPNTITSIGEYIVNECFNLQAFYGKFASSDNRCLIIDDVLYSFAQGGLTEYTVPDGVTMVAACAFAQNRLTKIVFPTSVTSLGECMFFQSYQLKEVYFMSTTPPAGNNTMFVRTDPTLKIYVPRESVDAYKNAPYWCDKANQIFGYDF